VRTLCERLIIVFMMYGRPLVMTSKLFLGDTCSADVPHMHEES